MDLRPESICIEPELENGEPADHAAAVALLRSSDEAKRLSDERWEERRQTAQAIATLRDRDRVADPILDEIAELERASLRRRVNFGKAASAPGVMHHNSVHHERNFDNIDLLRESPASRISGNWGEKTFKAPYPGKLTFGHHELPGTDGEMFADLQTGELRATSHIFEANHTARVVAGFWVNFGFLVPMNPLLVGMGADGNSAHRRHGFASLVPTFAANFTDWLVSASDLEAASSGTLMMIVESNSVTRLRHEIPLWKERSTGGPYRDDVEFPPVRAPASPWFHVDTLHPCKAFVGIRVAVEGARAGRAFGIAYGSIKTTITSIHVNQFAVS